MSRPASACCQASSERQDRFYRPRVNASGLSDPRRLPSTSAPLPAFAEGARHRTQSFAAPGRLPALFRSSICSRMKGARPSTVVTGYSPVVARTARCLPTSAIVTNCEHNRYRSIEPRTPRRSRLLRSFFCGWPGSFRSVASREFTGQGPLRSPSQRLPTAIARVGSLTPTRLARTPPVAILFPPGAGEAAAEDVPSFGGTSTGSPSWAPLTRSPAL
jgi:hypothetical protein